MSYEGYSQCICKNGHYFEHDCYAESVCPECQDPGTESAWENMVDQTNGDEQGYIPLEKLKEKFLVYDEVVETCNLGSQHITKSAIFRVPTREETDPLRTYLDWDDDGKRKPY